MDADLILLSELSPAPWGATDHLILRLAYEKLRGNPRERQRLDAALKRLLDRCLIEIAVEDDFETGEKTMVVYRYGEAPPVMPSGQKTVLIRRERL